MSSDYDATEFVDGDFQTHKSPFSAISASAGQGRRAPTTLENARMEWNTARLKFPILAGTSESNNAATIKGPAPVASVFGGIGFGELCRLGFAMTWPLAGVVLLALGVLVALLLRH